MLLGRLRVWAGNPSLRLLAKTAGPLLREPRELNHATLAYVFRPGRRRLDLDVVVAAVRALGLDEADVDQWRRACIHVHSQAKTGGATGVFRQLPAALATFTGRESDLEVLLQKVEAASDASRTVVIAAIEGMGGVGKTQLAIHLAHSVLRSGRFSDIQLYVNLRGFDADQLPVDPGDVLDGFLRALEVPAEEIPAGLDQRAAMFRACLDGRAAVVLLDNAADERQVAPLIPGSPACLVLVTSRRSLLGLEYADQYFLDVFTADESIALLRRVAGAIRVDAEPEAAARIVEACGRLPLAVALAAARLRSRPTWSLAHLDERLRTRGLGALQTTDRRLAAVVDLSLRDLDTPTRRLFDQLGTYPGRDFSVPAIAALVGTTVAKAEQGLERLLDEHLIQQKVADRYEMHDLIHAYARQRAASVIDAQTREAALDRLLTWYLHTADTAAAVLDGHRHPLRLPALEDSIELPGFASRDEALSWFDSERANLVAVTDVNRSRHMVWMLAAVCIPYYKLRKVWNEWTSTHRVGLAVAEQLADRQGQARMHQGLGHAKSDLHQFDEALHHYQAALELYGDADPHSAVRVLGSLAALHGQRRELEQSVAYSHQAVQLARECGAARTEAVILGNLGTAYAMLERYDEATQHLTDALSRREALGDLYGQGMVLNNLGEVARLQGHLDEAVNHLRRSVEIRQACGDRRGQACTMAQLGEIAHTRGDLDAARERWREALSIYEELGDPEATDVRSRLGSTSLARE